MSDDIRSAAQQLMQGRLDAVDAVASRSRDLEAKRAALEESERSYAAAHKAAVDAGWSEKELRQIGLPNPSRKTPGRPRKRGGSVTQAQAANGPEQSEQ